MAQATRESGFALRPITGDDYAFHGLQFTRISDLGSKLVCYREGLVFGNLQSAILCQGAPQRSG